MAFTPNMKYGKASEFTDGGILLTKLFVYENKKNKGTFGAMATVLFGEYSESVDIMLSDVKIAGLTDVKYDSEEKQKEAFKKANEELEAKIQASKHGMLSGILVDLTDFEITARATAYKDAAGNANGNVVFGAKAENVVFLDEKDKQQKNGTAGNNNAQ